MAVSALSFQVHPSSGVPIYRQIMDQVCALIAGGKLEPGDLLPSVRQVGTALGVNMMTVSKAYSKLEADGVLERSRGQGMIVRKEGVGGTVAERRRELRPLADPLVVRGRQLGLNDAQIVGVVRAAQRELDQKGVPHV